MNMHKFRTLASGTALVWACLATSAMAQETTGAAAASDRDQLRNVQQSIIFDKAVDFLVSKAKVSTVQPKA